MHTHAYLRTMKHILLFGAGKSASVLIEYLKNTAATRQWKVTVADADEQAVRQKVGEHPLVQPVALLLEDAAKRKALVQAADVVISLMPPALHLLIAQDCLDCGKHLLTASYVSDAIRALAPAAAKKGVLFLCEMGLDPGIDHMSAMQLVHRIRQQGGEITAFRSHCGGLVAPESDNNPWHYKISWNPRNVVLAGKAGALYKEDGQVVEKNYEVLFAHCPTLEVAGLGTLAYYPNRDALQYADVYGLEEAATFVRTTLRYPAFCTGWQQVVALRLTDEEKIYDTTHLRYRDFYRQHLQHWGFSDPAGNGLLHEQFSYLGLFEDRLINHGFCSAADILQLALETRLALQPEDHDMIVMVHELEYRVQEQPHHITSTLVVKGRNNLHTAMATTVGLPLGIAAGLLLEGKLPLTGLHIPIIPEIYEPVLAGLERQGIVFTEATA